MPTAPDPSIAPAMPRSRRHPQAAVPRTTSAPSSAAVPTDDGAPAGAAAPRLDRTLTYRLHTLNKLSDRASQAAYLADTGLPLGEGRCLTAVGAFAPLSISELASRANLDKGQASRAAQSLVDQGLIAKASNAADARGVELTLTRKGRAAYRRVMAVVERRNDEIFGCLSAAETAQLGRLLDRLIAHARGSAAGSDGNGDGTVAPAA